MRNYRSKHLTAAVAVFGLTVGAAQAVPVFINGSFEADAWSPGSTPHVNPSGWVTVQSSDSRFVEGVHNTSDLTQSHTPYGDQFIILCARDCEGGTVGSVSQTLSGFQMGAQYELSFAQSPEFGRDTGSNGAIGDDLVNVLISGVGSTSQNFSAAAVAIFGRQWADWQSQSMVFTADSGTLTFQFTGVFPSCEFRLGAFCYFESGIDNLSLTQIPEPASLALVGLGLVGLRFCRRKRA